MIVLSLFHLSLPLHSTFFPVLFFLSSFSLFPVCAHQHVLCPSVGGGFLPHPLFPLSRTSRGSNFSIISVDASVQVSGGNSPCFEGGVVPGSLPSPRAVPTFRGGDNEVCWPGGTRRRAGGRLCSPPLSLLHLSSLDPHIPPTLPS